MHLRADGQCCELFLKADEIDPRAVSLEPSCPAAWAPASFAGGLDGKGDGSSDQILETHGRSIAQKESPARGAERGLIMFGEVCWDRDGRRTLRPVSKGSAGLNVKRGC